MSNAINVYDMEALKKNFERLDLVQIFCDY